MNILFAASEARPYAASGGLADVIGSLPVELNDMGHKCCVVMPLYKNMKQELREELQYVTDMTIEIGWRKQYCEVFKGVYKNVTYYLVDSQYYFGRDGLYGFYDDAERFIFFSRAVIELIPKINFKPDIINANDWQTAMIPVYLKTVYQFREEYENIKTVFTIHNIQYQGIFGLDIINELMGISSYYTNILEYDGSVNMMKGAFETADYITTVSPTYAEEILDPWFAYGLDRILVQKKDKLVGILNGIDTDSYDPSTDEDIPFKYSSRALSGKNKCKDSLRKEMGLEKCDKPLVGIVTRFVAHKGIGMIRYVFEEMISKGVQFVVLGSGEQTYEDFFREMGERHKGNVSVTLGFKPELARKIYAGADIFLMPSENEPCGLAQMISLRYGTIPIVRETGGLKDTVIDDGESKGNGFTVKTCNAHDMMNSVMRAVDKFKNQKEWKQLQRRAMKCDHSWTVSAKEYIKLYQKILNIND